MAKSLGELAAAVPRDSVPEVVLESLETQLDLFHQEPLPRRDEVPVHYLDLATTSKPTRAERPARNVERSA